MSGPNKHLSFPCLFPSLLEWVREWSPREPTRLVKSFSPQQLCQTGPSPSMFSTTTQRGKAWEESGSTEPRILKSSGAVMDSQAFVAPLSRLNTLIVLLFYKCDFFFYSSLFKSNIYAATLFFYFVFVILVTV